MARSQGASQRGIQLRDEAERAREAYDSCVCLVDVDEHASLERACLLARSESILLLISNLKFEVWLRWHAEQHTSTMSSAQLDGHMRKLRLLDGKRLAASFPIEDVEQACEVARRVDPLLSSCRKGPDPSSAMPLLVDLLSLQPSSQR